MQAFEWEQRDDSTPLYTHVIAGSLAGISEHLSMIPLDNVKTHCQAGRSFPIREIIKRIYKAGGLVNFYSGSTVVAIGCAPAHAIYFSIYEQAIRILNCKPQDDVAKFAFVGALSAMFHDLIMTPTEALKQRVQLLRSSNARIGIGEVFRTMYRQQGLAAFYRSFPINYAMNIPFGSFIIVLNEKLKYYFGVKDGDQSLNYYLCGAAAGGIASIPTTPLDVIKTKLNIQNCLNEKCEKKAVCNVLLNKIERVSNVEAMGFKTKRGQVWVRSSKEMSTKREDVIRYRNVIHAFKTIWKEQGLRGFFQGLKMRMVIQSVSSGVAWGTYQIVKNQFTPLQH